LEDIAVRFLEQSKKRKATVAVDKVINRVEDLLEVNTLALDKQISLMNYLRDVLFTGLKYVTKDTVEKGNTLTKISEYLQLTSESN
jgi:hypothetical protein